MLVSNTAGMEAVHSSMANLVGDPGLTRFVGARWLGSGEEGGAWSATDGPGGRRVVLKHVSPRARGELQRAWETLARVGSPHLPAVLEFVPAADGGVWLVTAWVEGHSLPPGPVAPHQAVAEALAVAHALAAIHGTGTHHGDVSAGNVVLTSTRGVVLIDLARLGRCGSGTPGFLAPEVLAGGGGAAADVFALGCLLCWRLFGAVPWQRPEALLRVRTTTEVAARLRALAQEAGAAVPSPVLRTIERMLAPEPTRRWPDARPIIHQLDRLAVLIDEAGTSSSRSRWWVPQRWPYRGRALEGVVARLMAAEDRPRLVAVTGPAGSGRSRLVEEIVLALQAASLTGRDAGAARLADPDRVAAVLGDDSAQWLEAWMGPSAAADLRVVGVPEPLSWPAGFGAADLRGTALAVAASWARVTLVATVEEDVAATLADTPAVMVLPVERWNDHELGQVIDSVQQVGGSRAQWVAALRAVTGGWPGAVVRTLTGCAAAAVLEPDAQAMADAHQQTAGVDALSPEVAERVLRAHWWATDGHEELPPHLQDGGRPLLSAVARARTSLGPSATRALAVAHLANTEAAASSRALDVALDADDAAEVQARILAPAFERTLVDGAWFRLRPWLEAGGIDRVSPLAMVAVAEAALRRGEAQLALQWSGRQSSVTAIALSARALQRLGKSQQSLTLLRAPLAQPRHPSMSETDRDGLDRCLGLAWRAQVDLGQADAAFSQAQAWAADVPRGRGEGTAIALLWGAYAAIAVGEADHATEWLDAAARHCGKDGRQDVEVLARVAQLRGNLAQVAGRFEQAQYCYDAATRSFAAADDRMGLLGIQAGLANLSVATADLATGIAHGRAAFQGFMARAELQRLPETASALVQLLHRIGQSVEAEAVASATRALLTRSSAPSALGLARLRRIDAELLWADPLRRAGAAAAFAEAAAQLQSAQAIREAVDAKVREAAVHCSLGRTVAAKMCLDEAEAWGTDALDDGVSLVLQLERMRVAARTGDQPAIDRASDRLRHLPGPAELRACGQLELVWHYVRSLFAASRARLPPGHPLRAQAARSVVEILEVMVAKAPVDEQKAAHAALLGEGGNVETLRDLLDELEGGEGKTSAVAERPSAGPERSSEAIRLLRMYRRLAREDELEPLLGHVVDAMMELTDAERGAVVVHAPGPEGEPLVVTRELAAGSDGFKFSRAVIRRVMESGEPVLSVDAAEDERFDRSGSISHLNLRSVLAVPLVFRGEQLGAAYVDHRLRRGNFDDGDLARMEEFAELAALAVAHARALAAVRRQAAALERQSAELAELLEERDAEVQGLREAVRSSDPVRDSYRGIVGASPSMQRVFRLIDRLAESDVPVVVRGESGTGKELVARAIHEAGPRSKGPFVAENCGAIPETLLEGVLFGHARGAFTGASRARAGLFEAAHGGTLFLDEISEMSPGMQTKLLRVLQQGEVRRLGENAERAVDVRVIAASNRNLEEMIERGEFRSDLYYRIHVVPLRLPPLRERLEDLPVLVRHFLAKHGGEGLQVASATFRRLQDHPWPGNVRELENEIQRWVALAADTVTPSDLSLAIGRAGSGAQPDDANLDLRVHVDRLESRLIVEALERTQGNQTQAATLLGLSRYGLQKKLKRLEIQR